MKYRLLAPEVIQSSAMDCGPAVLKSVLSGFGIAVSYSQLRTACATDIDGTSIDSLEELATRYGLRAEQVLVPVDHLRLPRVVSLPAIAITRLPHGGTHFVAVWRATSSWVQVMDPSVGRRFLRWERFLQEVYVHEAAIPAAAWREWAGGEGFLAALRLRLRALGVDPQPLVLSALADPGAQRLAHLDAATRMVAMLAASGGVRAGEQASALLRGIVAAAGAAPDDAGSAGDTGDADRDGAPVIPKEFYSARRLPSSGAEEPAMMQVRGAVLVQVLGAAPAEAAVVPSAVATPPQAEPHPMRGLWAQLPALGRLGALLLPIGALLGSAGETVEVVLLRALLDAAPQLGLPMQRLSALAACLLLALAILAVDLGLFSSALRLGRLLEMQLRVALLARLPRLGDSYFSSRPVSDLADRSHQLFRVREVPLLLSLFIRTLGQLLLTAAVLSWLDPRGAPYIALLTALAIGIPVLLHPLLIERDLRTRSHQGSLVRFHLDTLLGTTPLRAHGAEAPLRSAHEDLLCEWATARRSLGRAVLLLLGGQGLLCTLVLSALWLGYLGRHRDPSGLLLLAYLSLSVPAFGQMLALYLRQYPALRSGILRLLEPLQAPTEDAQGADVEMETESAEPPAGRAAGADVVLSGVAVRAGGQAVLREIDLHIAPGSQVAIVGASGSGKSTLLGLLLGLYRAAAGSVRVDGAALEGPALGRLRSETAWVDPAVQLQNRSLLDNLRYGSGPDPAPLVDVLAAAQLEPVLARLPAGLQTPLGEGGALVSGGEGQRVRLGRALSRPAPRLILLDEPLRGLGRADRHELLRQARARAGGATLLCVTHDIGETLDFARVLVIEAGRIVEDGAPAALLSHPQGRYRALLDAEKETATEVWGHRRWRRLQLSNGQLREEP